MSSENNDWRARTASFTWDDLISVIKGVFMVGVWFVFIVCIIDVIIACVPKSYSENSPLDVIYFIPCLIITSTIIVVSQFNKLNNSLKEIKKAIEDKQPVIIQKRVSASEQDKK